MTVTEKAGWKQYRFGCVLSPQMQRFINMEDWQCRQTLSMLKDATWLWPAGRLAAGRIWHWATRKGVVLYERRHWPWFKEAEMQTVPSSAENSYSSEPKDNISLWVSFIQTSSALMIIPLKGELLSINNGELTQNYRVLACSRCDIGRSELEPGDI